MMTAVRQTVTVQAGGRLELVAPDLQPGTVADVIVLVSAEQPSPPLTTAEWLAELRRFQEAAALTPEAAQAWAREVRLEREAWPLGGAPVE